MSKEVQFLLAVLNGRASDIDNSSVNWDELLVLAESHGLLPAFCRSYSRELPKTWRERLRSHWAMSARFASELQRLLDLFAQHGIEALPLKGPVLAELLYGSLSLRTFDDLDLLVKTADFAVAQSILSGEGFVPVDEVGNYHRGFVAHGMFVELHFAPASPSLPRFDIDAAWTRSRAINFHGHPTRVFEKADLLLYLVLHGVKHHFARLVWLLDVTRALGSLDDRDVIHLLEMARSAGVEGALLTSCDLARIVFDAALPVRISSEIALSHKSSAQAQILADMLLSGPAKVGSLTQNAGIFVSLESDARRRWAHRLRFLVPTEQDRLWAKRHGIPQIWRVCLRPCRLLFRYGPAIAIQTLFPNLTHGTEGSIRKL